MINAVIGDITSILEDKVIIRCGHLEYNIFVSSQTVSKLSNLITKKDVRLVTVLQHREDSMTLYGFYDEFERDVFIQLQTVPGIAAKGAIKILSGINIENLISYLDDGNIKALSKIPGIGSKTAQRLVLSLRGKLVLDEDKEMVAVAKTEVHPYKDLIAAFIDMGYDRAQVERKVNTLVKENKDLLQNMTEKEAEQVLFRLAMKNLN